MTAAAEPDDGLRIEHAGAISWIVLDRPNQANALSGALLEAFSAALRRLEREGRPVVGVRAAGRGFCSGMDLGQYGGQQDPGADAARLQANLDRWLAIWDHPKPVIAAVHGYCVGVAAQLCVFADLTLVAEDARISEPALPIGGGFIAPTWVALVGHKRAKEFAFLPGNTIDGPTAVEWGWANHSLPAGQLVAAAEALAERIAQIPPDVLRSKKQAINRAAEAAGFRQATRGLAETDALLHTTPAVLAIRERMRTEGLKALVAEYAGPSSSEIIRQHGTTS